MLELLVDKVDGDLLKAVIFKDLETGDVEHGAEVGLLQSGVDEGVLRGIYSDEVVLGGKCCREMEVNYIFSLTLHFSISHLKTRS